MFGKKSREDVIKKVSKEIVALYNDVREKNRTKNATALKRKRADKEFDADLFKDQEDVRIRKKYLRRFKKIEKDIVKYDIQRRRLIPVIKELEYLIRFFVIVDESLQEAMKK